METRHHFYADSDRGLPLHAMLIGGGQAEEQGPYDWDGLKRGPARFAIFQYTLAGEGALRFDGREQRLRPGDAMLVLCPHAHRYWRPAHSPAWTFWYLLVNGQEALRILLAIQARVGPVLHLAPESPVVRRGEEILAELEEPHAPNPFLRSRLAYDFVTRLAEDVFAPRREESPLVRELRRLLAEELATGTSLDALAARLRLSKFHLLRRFREETGTTPRQYQEELRLHQAMRLLRQPEYAVKEIAAATGFGDPGYFAKVFRRQLGCSPREFRARGY